MALVVLVTVLTLPAGASGRPVRRPGRSPRSVTLEWVGDIAMSTERGLPPGGLDRAIGPVAGDLRAAEITLGNLEGTLSTGGVSKCASLSSGVCFAFQAPPSYALALRSVGFDLVNQANNHSMDFGAAGRAQTLAALDRAGIAHTGFPGEITYLRANGIRVAFLGFAPYASDANLLDIAGARALVRRARRHAAIVVVIIHAGAEGADQLHTPYGTQFFLGENRGDARAFAHAVIDAGASIVLGSGPHVIRGVERYRGRLIAYSLGNFVGYHTLAGGAAGLRCGQGRRPRPGELERQPGGEDHHGRRREAHQRLGAEPAGGEGDDVGGPGGHRGPGGVLQARDHEGHILGPDSRRLGGGVEEPRQVPLGGAGRAAAGVLVEAQRRSGASAASSRQSRAAGSRPRS